MNKNVCYTCIVGNYDTLKEPLVISDDFDYICFTDNKNLKSDNWNIKPIPENLLSFNNGKINRYIKWTPHILFPEYEFSIYVDGSLTIQNDLLELKNNFCNDLNIPMYFISHNKRKCVYEEFLANARGKKEDITKLYNQMHKYFEEGLPFNYLLTHNCILFRYHNNPIYINFSNALMEEMNNTTFRDQLSSPYIIWKQNIKENIKLIDTKIIKQYFDYDNSWKHDLKYVKEQSILQNVLHKIIVNNILDKLELELYLNLLNKMFRSYM